MLQRAISNARTPLAQFKIVFNHALDMNCKLSTTEYSFGEWKSSDMKEESSPATSVMEEASRKAEQVVSE